jgi:hypothetical protein
MSFLFSPGYVHTYLQVKLVEVEDLHPVPDYVTTFFCWNQNKNCYCKVGTVLAQTPKENSNALYSLIG